jgi:hypothetical protein
VTAFQLWRALVQTPLLKKKKKKKKKNYQVRTTHEWWGERILRSQK